MLGIVVTCLALPFLFAAAARIVPWLLPRCASLLIFGKPCPLCGLTRGLALLMQGHVSQAAGMNAMALPVLLLLLAELVLRSLVSFAPLAPERLARLSRIDLRVHLALLAAYIVYSIVFFARSATP
jgi:hypothetical protein